MVSADTGQILGCGIDCSDCKMRVLENSKLAVLIQSKDRGLGEFLRILLYKNGPNYPFFYVGYLGNVYTGECH